MDDGNEGVALIFINTYKTNVQTHLIFANNVSVGLLLFISRYSDSLYVILIFQHRINILKKLFSLNMLVCIND